MNLTYNYPALDCKKVALIQNHPTLPPPVSYSSSNTLHINKIGLRFKTNNEIFYEIVIIYIFMKYHLTDKMKLFQSTLLS